MKVFQKTGVVRLGDQAGIALITVMLVLMLALAMMAGMFAAVTGDTRTNAIDRDQSQAYAAAHAGLEKLTTDLGRLFETDVSPNAAQIAAVAANPPNIQGFNYVSPGGGAGYTITFNPDPCVCPNAGNPVPDASSNVTTGPYDGLRGIITPYNLMVTARTTGGSEVRLRRQIQTVAIPVFQFGVFGERNVSFHAGAPFDFGGRVHTNGHLFLAAGTGQSVTFRDRLTAVGQVVRTRLENNNLVTNSGHTGTVSIPTVIGTTWRNLASTEGSVTDGIGSAAWSGWTNLSTVTYNSIIRNTLTGARALNLPLTTQGAAPIDIIRRPPANENTTNPPVFGQRFYSQASLRILLSDRVSDFTSLPGITGTAPVLLDSTFAVAGGMPPVAASIGPNSAAITATGGTGSTSTGTLTIAGGTVPNWLKAAGVAPASLSITFGASTVTACTGMTATTLTGCTVSGATVPNGVTSGPIALASGGTITITRPNNCTGGTCTVGTNRTIPIVSTRDLAIGSRLIWSQNNGAPARPMPLTCSGYTATQLTGCYWTSTPSGSVNTHALQNAGQTLLGGYIKVEMQNNAGVWSDVTTEILNLGFSALNQEGKLCTTAEDPTPNAVLRLQRLRDNGVNPAAGGSCGYNASTLATDYWPNVLFDAREATFRDVATDSAMTMGGVINYVALDTNNLRRWFAGTIGASGTQALNNGGNGYIVYFSDRRGNHDDTQAGSPETGEYGNEDSINSAAGAGSSAANGALDGGEDRNENGTLQTYGATVSTVAGIVPAGALAPFDGAATPLTAITTANSPQARVNKQVLFRRALKLINGGIVGGVASLPGPGFTVASENAVYVQGDYNAVSNNANAAGSVAAAVIADSVMILSNNWLDARSFTTLSFGGTWSQDYMSRPASTTGYRFGLIAGKSIPFDKPAWAALGNWGTDGGVHNFMRMLENWSGDTANYRGSIVSLYTARQFIGMFKNNANTYFQPTRNFAFDTNFLQPQLLPPGTPMFRDINTLQFRQILRPNQ